MYTISSVRYFTTTLFVTPAGPQTEKQSNPFILFLFLRHPTFLSLIVSLRTAQRAPLFVLFLRVSFSPFHFSGPAFELNTCNPLEWTYI